MIYEVTKTTYLYLYVEDDYVTSFELKEEKHRIKLYSNYTNNQNLENVLKEMKIDKNQMSGCVKLHDFDCCLSHEFCSKIYYTRKPASPRYDLLKILENYFPAEFSKLVKMAENNDKDLDDMLEDDTDLCYIAVSEGFIGVAIE